MSIGEFPISGYWVEMSHGLKSLLGVRRYHIPMFYWTAVEISWKSAPKLQLESHNSFR